MLTDIVIILDRSGSMHGQVNDTIGGVNAFIEKQREVEGQARVTVALFDHEIQILHDRMRLDEVPPLTTDTYIPRGGTALRDAVGKTLGNLREQQANEVEKPDATIVMIVTDGEDNHHNQEYTMDQVKALVKEATEKHGWEIHFLSAKLDAFRAGAQQMGIHTGTTMSWAGDKGGYNAAIDYMTLNATRVRMKKKQA